MRIKINNTSLPRCVCGGRACYVPTRYDVRVECRECHRCTDLCGDADKAAREWRAMTATKERITP